MSDWDDLVDAGWGDADGNMTDAFWDSCEETEDDEENSNALPVNLTYIGANAVMRENLLANKLDNANINLVVILERENTYDNLALRVGCNGLCVGYIVKKRNGIYDDYSKKVEEFCFDSNNNLRELELKWDGKQLYLHQETSKDSDEELLREYSRERERKAIEKEKETR